MWSLQLKQIIVVVVAVVVVVFAIDVAVSTVVDEVFALVDFSSYVIAVVVLDVVVVIIVLDVVVSNEAVIAVDPFFVVFDVVLYLLKLLHS